MRTSALPPPRLLAALMVTTMLGSTTAKITDETAGAEFMKELDIRYSHECNLEMVARWDYITDVTDPDKEEAANAAAVRYLGFQGDAAVNCTEYEYEGFEDDELYRRFRFLSKQGPGALNGEDLTQYKALQANMETIYSTATICDFYDPTRCDLTLEPDIEAIMAYSENWDELRHVWDEWRENTGKLMRDDFISFVDLSNKAAVLDGFPDTSMSWLNPYTVDEREASAANTNQLDQEQFRTMVDKVWNEVSEKLYKKLHAYVRMRLDEVYPGHIDLTEPIPAHILGNMWAQTWSNIARHVMPFPEFPSFDVTESMVENGWDIQHMFEAAQDFFASIGLFPMTDIFWEKSVINQTAWGKTIVCHASAEDFCLGPDGSDYRIKMCTEVNMEDLVTVHHEMGHIEYFMAYKFLPHVFRNAANPGFHEAIGDLIALSVSTPEHLEKVLGLTPSRSKSTNKDEIEDEGESRYTDEEKQDLNFLMKMALDKIAFLPFGYLIDKYRWGVFDGSIPTEELNAGWWKLREELQGVTPPGQARGEEFFDPGAKYHVPANVPYIRYFVSFIVQFQFHQRLCEAAEHTGPLHKCDIYNNDAAGKLLRTALEKGFSEPWPLVLSELGGSFDMDPQAIITYFQPLITFLEEELQDAGQCIGWGGDCLISELETDEEEHRRLDFLRISADPSLTPSTTESTEGPDTTSEPPTIEEEARKAMEQMNERMLKVVQQATATDWLYYTDVTADHEAAANEAWLRVSQQFRIDHEEVIMKYYEDSLSFEDESLKRQFKLQKNLGTAALGDTDLENLNEIISGMTTTFTSKVCPYNNQGCDPLSDGYNSDKLEGEMAEKRDYNELKYYWEKWRDVSGRPIKSNYTKYIDLQNIAAVMNGFSDAGEMWLDPYTDTDYNSQTFKTEIEALWNTTQPLYLKLHAYVLNELKNTYEKDIPKSEKLIPAHLVGNMWAQSWENIYDLVKPYPEVDIPDISEDLKNNINNVTEMFEIAEEFFVDIGLYSMTPDFWSHSLFEEPKDREVICHASAWDFFDTDNPRADGRFRIKMCTNKTQEDFTVIHHEMGHTQYQMAYSQPKNERPLVFRDGANPGFHEAIGDTISLSVNTPKHLQMISDSLNSNNATEEEEEDEEEEDNDEIYSFFLEEEQTDLNDTVKQDINFLMKTALAKVAFLPFAYIIDQWRWEAFANNNTDLEYNKLWWKKRIELQGIRPPDKRYPVTDFDIGSKYHVPTSVPYIRYFVAHILQFQFHQELCGHTNFTGDIYNCDINGIKDAGSHLLTMLRKGSSEPWQSQLKEFLTDGGSMDSGALLSYFAPLNDFLDDYIEENELTPGWDGVNIDDYMKEERQDIPATVPIVVGVVLAVMVVIVIIAYFVGRAKQKSKKKDLVTVPPSSSPAETIELDAEAGKDGQQPATSSEDKTEHF